MSQEASASEAAGDVPTALALWREALELLPPQSRQYQAIVERITALGEAGGAAPKAGPKGSSRSSRAAAGLGGIGLLFWKLKTLLLGLAKASTFFSMLLSLGVYWDIFGWKLALGLVLSIYVHEMGHVIALRRLGFKASNPMFIPGLGALIRLKQQVANPREDAIIGLAGPIYGLGAALVSLGLFGVTHQPIFAAIAAWGAAINLFNLTPIWTLDGGRGFHAMSTLHKWLAAATVGAAWWYTQNNFIGLLALVCAYRALTDPRSAKGDTAAASKYGLLVLALTAVTLAEKWVPLHGH
jgi:Zn-dependent protease